MILINRTCGRRPAPGRRRCCRTGRPRPCAPPAPWRRCVRAARTPLEPPVKNTVSTVRRHAGIAQQALHGGADLVDQARDRLSNAARSDLQRRRRQAVEVELDRGRVGQADLASSTCIASQWPARSSISLRRRASLAGSARRAPGLPAGPCSCGVGLVDRVPGRQVEVIARRHLAPDTQRAAVAEQRHHRRQAQVFVEVGAADVHAAGGQDVVAPLAAPARRARRTSEKSEVPPPMSAISTSSSLSIAIRSRRRRRSARTGRRSRLKPTARAISASVSSASGRPAGRRRRRTPGGRTRRW
jgi:hypothetical protein